MSKCCYGEGRGGTRHNLIREDKRAGRGLEVRGIGIPSTGHKGKKEDILLLNQTAREGGRL